MGKKNPPTTMPVTLAASLSDLSHRLQQQGLKSLFTEDPDRAKRFSLEAGDIYFDFSKNSINADVLSSLIEWAKIVQLPLRIQQLMQGDKLNTSENRPALHTALRRETQQPLLLDGHNVMQDIAEQKAKMTTIVEKLHKGEWEGATGKTIQSIVHMGIGGSDLGPVMAVEALKPYKKTNLSIHFVSNIDPIAISAALDQVDPETTLFIISSKSFTTPETLANVEVAQKWLQNRLTEKTSASFNTIVSQHFIAVTANPEKAKAFGIDPEQILTFAPWVGGRYSIWSTIGLPLALCIGMKQFEEFLAGARVMDEHFLQAPLSQNMPVILALLGAWNIHFGNMPTLAILPYAQGLSFLPDYLQQLDMESNGKSVKLNNESVSYMTGPIVWGQAGTNGQHAFYQLIHQGTHAIAIDFILVANTTTQYPELHQQLLANGLAQSQALMQGRSDPKLSPMEVMQGNKPSNTLLLKKLSPFALGQLLALYEHKVFAQGVLWGINSFDQPGVELGKVLAKQIEACFATASNTATLDASTKTLLQKIAVFQTANKG